MSVDKTLVNRVMRKQIYTIHKEGESRVVPDRFSRERRETKNEEDFRRRTEDYRVNEARNSV